MAKDRSKKILREIEALRSEVLGRLDRIESRLARVEAQAGRTPSPQATGAIRPRETNGTSRPAAGLPSIPVAARVSPRADDSAHHVADPAAGVAAAMPGPVAPIGEAPPPADGEVRVIVSPLRDLILARAVEDSLTQSEGVESATLRELRGDSATIDVQAADGVSVLGALRQHLPVAFDVTASDENSVTIALAQPQATGVNGVAVPDAP